jgi:hypothetical protein
MGCYKELGYISTDYYNGYSGANGSHVKLLLEALRPILRNKRVDDIIY